jgi:hypothetical protein
VGHSTRPAGGTGEAGPGLACPHGDGHQDEQAGRGRNDRDRGADAGPLLAGWSIWVGIAISARSADVRVAQQLGVFASLPPLAVVALITLNVLSPSTGLALGLAAALLALDGLGWRAVAAMFDRERLVTGGRT